MENNFAARYVENSAVKDGRFDVWMYLSDSLNAVKDGYKALPGFECLTQDSYEQIFNREVEKFISEHCQ